MQALSFTKMHGLGNDFVVLDCTQQPFTLTPEQIVALGNRSTGVGFDQLLVVEPSTLANIDFNYRIFNCDGNEVEHCGNGARCFAKYVHDKKLTDKKTLNVQVKKGMIEITYLNDDEITVDMGVPIIEPNEIPFVADIEIGGQYPLVFKGKPYMGSVVSMGNPHVVFVVDSVRDFGGGAFTLAEFGAAIQQLPVFPQSVNVNIAEIKDRETILIRTYERGVGETAACGTGMCATMFAAYRLGLIEDKATLQASGGATTINYHDGKILMTGPARTIYEGQLIAEFWQAN